MRNILLLTGLISSGVVGAQLFSFSPGIYHNAELPLDGTVVLFTYITNLTADSVSIEWRKIEDTLPEAGLPGEGWFTEMCDPGNCFTYLPNNDVMPNKIAPGEAGFIKLILNAQGQEGAGFVHYWIYPESQMDLHEDCYFFVWTPGVAAIEEQAYDEISIYPNPATTHVKIGCLESGTLEISTIEGKQITACQILQPGCQTLDVGSFRKGVYIVTINGKNATRLIVN